MSSWANAKIKEVNSMATILLFDKCLNRFCIPNLKITSSMRGVKSIDLNSLTVDRDITVML